MDETIRFKIGEIVGYCPECNKKLVVRKGKYGTFIGCTGYPECTKTFNINKYEVPDYIYEIRKLDNINTYDELKKIINTTDNELIKEKAEEKLAENNYCTCGEKIKCRRVKRLTENYQDYHKEYYCKNCGTFIIRETPKYKKFERMGKIKN